MTNKKQWLKQNGVILGLSILIFGVGITLFQQSEPTEITVSSHSTATESLIETSTTSSSNQSSTVETSDIQDTAFHQLTSEQQTYVRQLYNDVKSWGIRSPQNDFEAEATTIAKKFITKYNEWSGETVDTHHQNMLPFLSERGKKTLRFFSQLAPEYAYANKKQWYINTAIAVARGQVSQKYRPQYPDTVEVKVFGFTAIKGADGRPISDYEPFHYYVRVGRDGVDYYVAYDDANGVRYDDDIDKWNES